MQIKDARLSAVRRLKGGILHRITVEVKSEDFPLANRLVCESWSDDGTLLGINITEEPQSESMNEPS